MKDTSHPSQTRASCVGAAPSRRILWLGIGVVGMLAVVLLASGQLGQAASYWPYLLLLACPLMHLFMRHGQKRKPGSQESASAETTEGQ